MNWQLALACVEWPLCTIETQHLDLKLFLFSHHEFHLFNVTFYDIIVIILICFGIFYWVHISLTKYKYLLLNNAKAKKSIRRVKTGSWDLYEKKKVVKVNDDRCQYQSSKVPLPIMPGYNLKVKNKDWLTVGCTCGCE